MVTITRHLTAKYKNLRLRKDPVYLLRSTQTLFNSFIKSGKRAQARRQIGAAFEQIRYTLRRPGLGEVIPSLFNEMRVIFNLTAVRRAKKMIDLPNPIPPLKQLLLAIQSFCKAVFVRFERTLNERFYSEISTAQFQHARSAYRIEANHLRARAVAANVHEVRKKRARKISACYKPWFSARIVLCNRRHDTKKGQLLSENKRGAALSIPTAANAKKVENCLEGFIALLPLR